MPNQIATWNPERDCWETGVEDIFGHSDVYSETWPTSGMTRNGVAYALPTWAPPTTGSASSSSPMLGTPRCAQGMTNDLRAGGHGPTLADEVEHLLPTPTAMDAHSSGGSTPSNVTLTDATVRTHMGTTPNLRHEPTGGRMPTPSTDGGNFEDQPLPIEEA